MIGAVSAPRVGPAPMGWGGAWWWEPLGDGASGVLLQSTRGSLDWVIGSSGGWGGGRDPKSLISELRLLSPRSYRN